MTLEMAVAVTIEAGGDPAGAEAEFARTDRNADGIICVMTQILPNDASGSDIWFIAKDNTSR